MVARQELIALPALTTPREGETKFIVKDSGIEQILSMAAARTILGTKGADGAQGPQGRQGSQGNQGYRGSTGYTGSKGSDGNNVNIKGTVAASVNLPTTGRSIGDCWITTNNNHVWVYIASATTDATHVNGFVDVGNIQGPQGPQGVQGAGFQGNQGFQGYAGSFGFQGFQGVQGDKGFQGTQGYT